MLIEIYGVDPIESRDLLELMRKMDKERKLNIGVFNPSPADNYDTVPSLSIIYEGKSTEQVERVQAALIEFGIVLPVRVAMM